ncbi:MAG: hypothetical protein ICV62_11010, partial [Cyanobacteria bacterium Co-bin13]|nr:hypothetical protein [Cyanobacteria bacterium Co-bin13]
MGTWIKETDSAIYLMQGGQWLSRVSKRPSQSNPQEQVVDISGLRSWFTRPDFPRAMTVSVGIDAEEPLPITAGGASTGGSGAGTTNPGTTGPGAVNPGTANPGTSPGTTGLGVVSPGTTGPG